MVPGRLATFAALATVAALGAAILAPGADAASRRIAISNYQWSQPQIQIDLGEHVTWYWVGPDILHSVTGESENARGLDSDPDTNLPQHRVGDSFELSFDQPGVYSFQCKLHSTVRGTVTVSADPGDPLAEPDPVPANRVDLEPPRIRHMSPPAAPLRGRGGQLHFWLGEPAKLDADYYRLAPHGEREFAGWGKWRGYLGLNEIRFGGRDKHFEAPPGRYLAELRATDRDNNVSDPRQVRFEIRRGG